MIFNSNLVDRVRTQLEGLKANGDIAKGAPFNQQALQKLLDDVVGVSARQEQAKAELHKSTQELDQKSRVLRDAFTRNVAFAQSHFGKFDKKLEEFGGRIAGTGKRGGKRTAGGTPK